MIAVLNRYYARERTRSLIETRPTSPVRTRNAPGKDSQKLRPTAYFSNHRLVVTCILFGALLSFAASSILSPFLIPLCCIIGGFIPYSIRGRRDAAWARRFAEDYPAVLLATASSLKSGMTPLLALERSVLLLKKESPLRREVLLLLDKLRCGIAKEKVLESFAADVPLPELSLFRSALLIVLEHGGRFGPTLDRLAAVTRDRLTLTSSALVSTSIMRMTANVVLVAAPLLVFVVSSSTDGYWEIFRTHSVANLIGSIGVALISASYLTLRHMSAFKP